MDDNLGPFSLFTVPFDKYQSKTHYKSRKKSRKSKQNTHRNQNHTHALRRQKRQNRQNSTLYVILGVLILVVVSTLLLFWVYSETADSESIDLQQSQKSYNQECSPGHDSVKVDEWFDANVDQILPAVPAILHNHNAIPDSFDEIQNPYALKKQGIQHFDNINTLPVTILEITGSGTLDPFVLWDCGDAAFTRFLKETNWSEAEIAQADTEARRELELGGRIADNDNLHLLKCTMNQNIQQMFNGHEIVADGTYMHFSKEDQNMMQYGWWVITENHQKKIINYRSCSPLRLLLIGEQDVTYDVVYDRNHFRVKGKLSMVKVKESLSNHVKVQIIYTNQ
jgi:hypothetical protein